MENIAKPVSTSQSLIFPSEKSKLFGWIIWGSVALFVAGCITTFLTMPEMLVMMIMSLLPMIMLVWLWFDTGYSILNDKLFYRSGFIKGEIRISTIRHIVRNKTLWSGLKPALAKNGLIIQYGKWEEVYISPVDKERFIDILVTINPEITVGDAMIEKPKINFNKY